MQSGIQLPWGIVFPFRKVFYSLKICLILIRQLYENNVFAQLYYTLKGNLSGS